MTEQKSESRVLTGAEVAIPRLGYRISATVIHYISSCSHSETNYNITTLGSVACDFCALWGEFSESMSPPLVVLFCVLTSQSERHNPQTQHITLNENDREV